MNKLIPILIVLPYFIINIFVILSVGSYFNLSIYLSLFCIGVINILINTVYKNLKKKFA